jgi:hypothetical protein
MLPKDENYGRTFRSFLERDLTREYATPTLLLALLGIVVAVWQNRRSFALLGAALVVASAAGLVYFPGDKYIFYLPAYLLIAVFAGIGAGALMSLVIRLVPPVVRPSVPTVIMTAMLIAICAAPFINPRWKAIQTSRSTFIVEDYVYPVNRPKEPRLVAECALSKVAEPEAILVLDWRALYSIYYVAHVEQGRTGLVIYQANPYPAQEPSPILLAEIIEQLRNGNVVYVDKPYNLSRDTYTLTRVRSACINYDLFKVSLKG